jgi:dTDP-4-dehydrorhamnose reductase
MVQPILLIGSNGQVGSYLFQVLTQIGNIIPITRKDVDLAEPESLRKVIRECQPQIIINAAAYTAVDKAQSEPQLANAINGTAPAVMAQEAERLGAYLIHISTDYVFDGNSSRPYSETDVTNPVSAYGTSKLAGEQAIQQICNRYLILRTAWVYGSLGKSNFVKTMLRLGRDREEIRVVADQIGTPTSAQNIASAIASLISLIQTNTVPSLTGIYHYTNSGAASWYDFAHAIFEEAQIVGFPLQIQQVIPITTPEYPTPAIRPAYSVLACQKISTLLGTYPPHWRQSLRVILKEMLQGEGLKG